MEFLLYLTSIGRDVYSLVSQTAKVVENSSVCRRSNIYGWYNDSTNTMTICTENIKNGPRFRYYINETLFHESVHLSQKCKNPFGRINQLGVRDIYLPPNKMKDLQNSVAASGSKYYNAEREAYYLEDKPERVFSYLKKYCFY